MITNEQIVSKVAEYLSIALFLKVDSPHSDYQRANQLIFELQMVLPIELLDILGKTIQKKMFPSECVAEFRKCYGHSIPLDKNLFMAHAPGIGKNQKDYP